MKKFSFTMPQTLYDQLMAHLFPGDGDEHGAVIAAGISQSAGYIRFLARTVIEALDGADYVRGKYGYRALTADFVARASDYCARERLCYFAVHCHGGSDSVGFSVIDADSHERGYPALLDITNGGPVGALVFAKNAVAGSIWLRDGVYPLQGLTVVGPNVRRLYSSRAHAPRGANPIYHRQSLIFGAAGQDLLNKTRVGIIGMGGAGSLVNEWLSRLGIGEIIAIDFDKVEPSNCPRTVGATHWDAQVWLSAKEWAPLRRLAGLFSSHKVSVGARVAKMANPRIKYHAIVGNITTMETALLLKDVDFLFLCADRAQSRLVFNALVHQYLIPGVQVGAKVQVNRDSGRVNEVFAVSRPVLPFEKGGCLLCNELIPAKQLQEEALSDEERRAQAYVDDPLIVAPSVITMNAVAGAQAVNDFLLGYFGLFSDSVNKGYLMQFCCDRQWSSVECRAVDGCLHCGKTSASAFARGDRAGLPCRG